MSKMTKEMTREEAKAAAGRGEPIPYHITGVDGIVHFISLEDKLNELTEEEKDEYMDRYMPPNGIRVMPKEEDVTL